MELVPGWLLGLVICGWIISFLFVLVGMFNLKVSNGIIFLLISVLFIIASPIYAAYIHKNCKELAVRDNSIKLLITSINFYIAFSISCVILAVIGFSSS